jgi:Sec-independent protein translocase protein TatA
VGILAIVLLVAAVLLVVGSEWPRLMSAVGADARQVRSRRRRKEKLTVVQGDGDDDFAASVQRDLESLPVIEKHDGRPRR